MRIGIGTWYDLTDEFLHYARQLGATGVVLGNWQDSPEFRYKRTWDFLELVRVKQRCNDHGLELESMQSVPFWFLDQVILGGPGRDEQIENYQETIRNVGRAGIPVVGFSWIVDLVWRTSATKTTRGGAVVSGFDHDLVRNAPLTHGRAYSDEELWRNYEYFLDAVLPVAEEAGVTLALHPNDPPVESVAGIPQIFRDFDSCRRALEVHPSDRIGLNFCMGTWSEMGVDVLAALDHFSSRGKIVLVHFRDVQGTVPVFQECFLGEGNVNVVEAVSILKRNGFDGVMIDDHVPSLLGDDTGPLALDPTGRFHWDPRGRAWSTGYMAGLVAAVKELA